MLYYTIRYDAMRCDAMPCDAMRCDARRDDAMRCETIRYDTILYDIYIYCTCSFTRIAAAAAAAAAIRSVMPRTSMLPFHFEPLLEAKAGYAKNGVASPESSFPQLFTAPLPNKDSCPTNQQTIRDSRAPIAT